jgi:gliding motility-associated-like protein
MRKIHVLKISALLLILFFREQALQACNFILTTSPTTDTTICANQVIFLQAFVTPPAGTYAYQWSANPPSAITNSTTLTPSVSPATTTVYTISVTDGGCSTVTSVTVNVAGIGAVVNAYPQDTVVCPGQKVQFTSNINPQTCGFTLGCSAPVLSSPMGAGAIVQPGAFTTGPSILGNFTSSGRSQMLFTAAEMRAAIGGTPGEPATIQSISFNLPANAPNTSPIGGVTVSVGCTGLDSLTYWINTLTPVFGPASYTCTSNSWNLISFANPYNWDGVSNFVIDICWNNAVNASQNNKALCTATPHTSYLFSGLNADVCGTNGVPQIFSYTRPNIEFNYCIPNINNFTIAWTPGSGPGSVNDPAISNPTANPNTTTNYSVTVSNAHCAGSAAITVLVDTSVVHINQKNDTICPGQLTTLSATVVGTVLPGPGYTLSWGKVGGPLTQTGSSITVNPTVTTMYVVAMTGGACTKYDTTTLTVVNLSLAADTVNATCNGTCNGKLIITPLNGTSPYTYVWSPGVSTVDSAVGLCASEQVTVTVRDVNGCTGTASGQVAQPTALTVKMDTLMEVSCNGGANGSLEALPSGGTGATSSFTYSWSNGLSPTQIVSGLSAGNYAVTVSDSLKCKAHTTGVISQPAPITFGPAFVQGDACNGGSSGIIKVDPMGGNGTAAQYTYTWSASEPSSATITGLSAGTYSVTVSDILSCTGSAQYVIRQPTKLQFQNPTQTPVTCFNGSNGTATVNPYGGTPMQGGNRYTFLWTPSGQTTATATNLSAETYIAKVTDDSGCTAFDTVTIKHAAQIIVNATVTNTSCNGYSNGGIAASVTNGVGSFSYNWNPAEPNSPDLSNLKAGAYSVTVTDANTCTGSNTFTVNQPPALSFNFPNVTQVACYGGNTGQIIASPTGGTLPYTYNWSPSGNSDTISNLAAGIYSLTVTDAHGCPDTTSYAVQQPSAALGVTSIITAVSCYGTSTGNITANANNGTFGTSGYSYLWSNGSTNASITSLPAGVYTVTVTDANLCTVSETDLVTQPALLIIDSIPVVSPSCNGLSTGVVTIVASGGTTPYTFTSNGQAWASPQANVAAGTYAIVVTDNNNCTAAQTITVTQPNALTDTLMTVNDPCYNAGSGSITAIVTGGVRPYSYTWTPQSSTDSVLSNLPAGTYSLEVADANGCTTPIMQAVINQPIPFTFSLDSTEVTCPGAHNGTVTITTDTGGTPPYGYAATQDSANFQFGTSNVIAGLDTGYYYIIVNDANGCTYESSIYIPSPIPDSFNVSLDTVSCYGGQYDDGQINLSSVFSPYEAYQYSIDSGAYGYNNGPTIVGLSAGRHIINILNNNNCLTTIDTVVPQPQQAFVSVYPTDTSILLGKSAQLSSAFTTYNMSSITSYNWIPSLGLSCVDCSNPVATPYSQSNQYTLSISYIAINRGQVCTAGDSLTIEVLNTEKIFIPNAFSPNGDGSNDMFVVYGDDIKTIDMAIFNRWGEKVFESTNQFNGWDGTYKGVMQSVGTYIYVAKVTFLDDTQLSKTGSITLVR